MGQLRFVFAFTALVVASLSTASCSGSVGSVPPATSNNSAPMPAIRHVIIMMQENRSFNNLFMGFPGADTAAAGACVPAPGPGSSSNTKPVCEHGGSVPLRPVRLEGTSGDISHDHRTFLREYDRGRMDGFDRASTGESYTSAAPAGLAPYAYVTRSEVQAYWDLAHQYTLGDHMFSTATASSFIAHQEIIAGTTRLNATESLTDEPDEITDWGCDAPPGTTTPVINIHGAEFPNGPFPCFDEYATMANLLDAGNTSWKYYVESRKNQSDISGQFWNGFDAIQHVACTNYDRRKGVVPGGDCVRGKDWSHIISPNRMVIYDIRHGSLPAVSWVIPKLIDSDHPAAGCNHGPHWVARVVNALGESKYWQDTAIVLLWDDWGGWYDNVPPPQLDYTSLGMRVPLVVISPYAKHHFVSHTQYEFGSILKFIEQNFGLGSLHSTDARANSIGDVFDFTQRPSVFKAIVAPMPPFMCPGSSEEIIEKDGVPS
jgi:phospholipase C